MRFRVWLLCFMFIFTGLLSQEMEESEGGDFLFLSTNDEVAEEVHSSAKGHEKPHCEESTLISYLKSLQVINPESLIVLAMKNKLEKRCHNISKTADLMESYLKSCKLEPEHEQYVNLLHGVKALHKKLCTDDPYKKTFMKHKACFGQLQAEVGDSCNGPADWSESSDSKHVCRAYQEIKDCYYIKASILCGEPAAKVFRGLVQCIIESIITVNCTMVALDDEHDPNISKEQRLLLQRQKLALARNEEDDTASSQPLAAPGPLQLLFVFFIVIMANNGICDSTSRYGGLY